VTVVAARPGSRRNCDWRESCREARGATRVTVEGEGEVEVVVVVGSIVPCTCTLTRRLPDSTL
jgi:hypothetical protein